MGLWISTYAVKKCENVPNQVLVNTPLYSLYLEELQRYRAFGGYPPFHDLKCFNGYIGEEDSPTIYDELHVPYKEHMDYLESLVTDIEDYNTIDKYSEIEIAFHKRDYGMATKMRKVLNTSGYFRLAVTDEQMYQIIKEVYEDSNYIKDIMNKVKDTHFFSVRIS